MWPALGLWGGRALFGLMAGSTALDMTSQLGWDPLGSKRRGKRLRELESSAELLGQEPELLQSRDEERLSELLGDFEFNNRLSGIGESSRAKMESVDDALLSSLISRNAGRLASISAPVEPPSAVELAMRMGWGA